MSKAILVLDDIPESCCDCICYDYAGNKPYCRASNRYFNIEDDFNIVNVRQDWCPLRTPKKLEYISNIVGEWSKGYRVGYNTCVNDILDNK